jgi:O-antigen ligase
VIAAAAVGLPGRISRAWRDFKHPGGPALSQNALARFGSANGNGRYQAWQVAVHYAGHHPLNGGGAGTFQLIWLPRATLPSYLINAHSLYFETLAELGVVGLVLLLGFLVLALWRAIANIAQASRSRAYAAGVAAALITFCVSAFYDWNWQVPVLPAAFMLLTAAVLAPRTARVRTKARNSPAQGRPAAQVAESGVAEERTSPRARPKYPLAIRAGLALASLAALVAIAVPLASTSALRKSQGAVTAGNLTQALAAARSAVRLESGSASGALQLALVLELRHQLPSALAAAKQAVRNEPQNWSTWLVLSRLQAENGHAGAALDAYRRARALNPRSPLFAHLAVNAGR